MELTQLKGSPRPIDLLRFVKTGLWVMGGAIITLAIITYAWQIDLPELFTWLENAFGILFITVYCALLAAGMMAIASLTKQDNGNVWYEVGQQAANGISTLALTFTLLGISLGIESLSNQELNPETVGAVIQTLTKHFSTAFMTTVVGLPTAQALRSSLAIRWAAITNKKQGEGK